jgi:tetraacyldisaccharide 4'-kinase
MTEKDAVKCRAFAGKQHWYLPVKAVPEAAFSEQLLNLLKRKA